jgi:hypothetical protein
MREFLPIKGPGGRAPTVKEKTALVVLSVTLILFVLTLLNGDAAFADEPARNPVFSIVGNLAQSTGVGILAAYAIVLLWSSLIFFKGERVAESRPLPGRAIATLGITIGLSGMLGIAQLDAAGSLGAIVGGAIGNAFGATFGVVVLLAMLLLGVHLAGQDAWAAFRGAPISVPSGSVASTATAPSVAPVSGGFSIPQANARVGVEAVVVDDGDPSADERTLAVTQAMDEIERSRGVTIVEIEPEGLHEVEEEREDEPTESAEGEPEDGETEESGLDWGSLAEPVEDEPIEGDSDQQDQEEEVQLEAEEPEAVVVDRPPSIGEEVDALSEPEPETEEAQVQAALDIVHSTLVSEMPPAVMPPVVIPPRVMPPVGEAAEVEVAEEEGLDATDPTVEDATVEGVAVEEVAVEEAAAEDIAAELAATEDSPAAENTTATEETAAAEDTEEDEEAEEAEFQEAKRLEEQVELEVETDDELEAEETEGEEEDDEWDDEAAVEEDQSEDASDSRSASYPTIAQPYLFPVHRREADEEADEDETEADSERVDPDSAEQPENADGTPQDAGSVPAEQVGSESGSSTNFDWRGRPVE